MKLDALKADVARLIRSLTPVDYYAWYPARVVKQNLDDLTLDVQPDDARVPGMERVPIRFGTPQTTAKVQAGARVLVGFAGGDPRLPVAGLWESATLDELNLGGGTEFVALATKVKTELSALRSTLAALVTAYNAHVHAGVTSGSSSSSPPAVPAASPSTVNDVNAAVVKAR